MSITIKFDAVWKLFGPFRRETEIRLADWPAIPPTELPVDGQACRGRDLSATFDLDLAPRLGGVQEGKTAVVFLPFAVSARGRIAFSFGADWWFEAALDGQPLLDTLATGNGQPAIRCDQFRKDVTLRPGRHLLAIRVIGGAAGFRLSLLIAPSANYATAVKSRWDTFYTVVDPKIRLGRVKPLHGVNNGPLTFGSAMDASAHYRELQIPWVRIHDPNWPHPREVDIPQIFPNEDADPADPASYDFRRTDTYIQSILATGAKIVYRLGTSIEHTKIKYFTHPPKDFARWAQVCTGIINHYNHGWANGFHYGITHWEIWNEPDIGPLMWSGTPEQYFALYAAAARAIKKCDPAVNVGGFAVSWVKSPMTTAFLEYCRKHRLPLDFFTWHCYAAAPGAIERDARLVRSLLDQYGFTHSESHLNEWNLYHCAGPFSFANAQLRKTVFDAQKNEIGASFSASVLMRLQDAAVDVTNYYDGQPTSLYCGLFDSYGLPQKTYRTFLAFRELVNYPVRIKATSVNGIDTLAACDARRKKVAVLLSKFGGPWVDHTVVVKNLPADIRHYELCLIDADHQLEAVQSGMIGPDGKITIRLMEYAVALLRLSVAR
ncbi:MAG: hypothetical protein WC708_08390 [Lentisphaeria bacterium]